MFMRNFDNGRKKTMLGQTLLCRLFIALLVFLIHVETVQARLIDMEHVDGSGNTNGEPRTTNASRRVCRTPECIKTASLVKSAMNLSVDPCTDFYQYACGGWINNNPIPSGKSYVIAFSKLGDKVNEVLKPKLETGINNIPGASTQLMRIPSDIYQSCVNSTAVEAVADGPLKQLIQDLGTWSMTGVWNERNWNFVDALATIHRDYTSLSGPLFSVEVIVNAHNNDEYIIKIDQAGPKLSTYKYNIITKIAAYKKFIEDVVKLLGGTNQTVVSQKAQRIIDFEAKLAAITIPARAKLRYHKMSINDLQREAPQFDWLTHLNRVFAPNILHGNEIIEVPSLPYLKRFMALVLAETKSDLANYLVWYVIQDEMPYMSTAYRQASSLYKRGTSGITGQEERWKTCMGYTNNRRLVGDIIGASYVRDNYNKVLQNRNMMKGIIDEIRRAFKENVKSLTWLDNTTKNAVYEKADTMGSEVSFPDYYVNTTLFASKFSKYDNIITNNTNFHGNKIAVTKAKNRARLGNFRTIPDKKEWWWTTPQSVGAFYLRESNTIFLPNGAIQPPFVYESDSLKPLNFGAMGYFIGHEITHGFDDTGSKFNKEGEISSQWWTNSSLNNFKAKIRCIVDQYSRYLVLGQHPIKANRTLGENIADNGGFKASLKAYLDWSRKNVNDLWLLPGLNVTNEQLFYIGFGQTWCYHATDQFKLRFMATQRISEPEFRVKGTVSNSVEFANAFNCQPNSPMNPTHKCSIWSKDGSLV